MAILDALMEDHDFRSQAFRPRGLFTESVAGASSFDAAIAFAIATPYAYRALLGDSESVAGASSYAAAISLAVATPFACRALLGNGPLENAHCDAGAILGEDSCAITQWGNDELRHNFKAYDIPLKPIFSAFPWKIFLLNSGWAFLTSYCSPATEEHHVRLVEPFKKSVCQFICEMSEFTIRRILESLTVLCAPQRIARKFVKDVGESVIRKVLRQMPTWKFFCRVSGTIFRGNILSVAASWVVQVVLDIYGFFFCKTKPKKESDETTGKTEKFKILGMKILGTTIRFGVSLVFASIGGAFGALILPSAPLWIASLGLPFITGHWIGYGLGYFGGLKIISFCYEKLGWEL